MEYYKAIEIVSKPLIYWQSTPQDDDNPLVVAEEFIPDYVFGVCPLKIEAGELVDRTALEMAAFEAEFNAKNVVDKQINIVAVLNAETFVFDAQTFPMHDSARLYYGLIEKLGGNRKVLTAGGVEYDLVDTDIPAFITALDNQLLTVIMR